jgi:hypothetical protein
MIYCRYHCRHAGENQEGAPERTGLVLYWDGIYESTISLRFLGIILRFLRLEASTFVFAFLQKCNSCTNLSFLHWLIVLYGFLKP